MNILFNHIWVNNPNNHYTEKTFGGRALVTLLEHLTTQNCINNNVNPDWTNLIDTVDAFDSFSFKFKKEMCQKKGKTFDEEKTRKKSMTNSVTLNPEVVQWLSNNCKEGFDFTNPEGKIKMPYEFSIAFENEDDAMKFIQHWSQFKNPISYYDYFDNIKKQLNPDTLELDTVTEFSSNQLFNF